MPTVNHVWRSACPSRSAASSPSKSSPHGPHARRCAAIPGYRCSAPGRRGGQLDVDMQHLHRLGASHVARVGPQEAVQFRRPFMSAPQCRGPDIR